MRRARLTGRSGCCRRRLRARWPLAFCNDLRDCCSLAFAGDDIGLIGTPWLLARPVLPGDGKLAFGFALLQWFMRNGVVAAGVRDAAPRAQSPTQRRASTAQAYARMLFSTVQRRELRLLARDRNYMVQALILPALIVGMQLLFSVGTGALDQVLGNTSHLAALAFGVAAYTLAFSSTQTINGEGHALWILYSVPHSLESVLAQKAKLWAAVAAIYPVLIFAVALVTTRDISAEFVALALIVLAGVPIVAVMGTAIGVFASDPLEQDIQRRIKISYLYLYMVLASLYAYAIYAPVAWQRVATIVLSALLAAALWQKARDHFDYLLDPAASPPSRVSVSDGLIAALVFFVLQGVILLVPIWRGQVPTANTVWVAFCVAGAVTYGAMRLVYWRARTEGVPRGGLRAAPRPEFLARFRAALTHPTSPTPRRRARRSCAASPIARPRPARCPPRWRRSRIAGSGRAGRCRRTWSPRRCGA